MMTFVHAALAILAMMAVLLLIAAFAIFVSLLVVGNDEHSPWADEDEIKRP